tara:strand:- start:1405 stop:1752 length:348 start_codon:yes stop_codon:yes gene_type:complete
MPVSTRIKSTLLTTLQSSINSIVLGFDGTPATNDDGGAGRPAITLTPKITIVDDTTLLIEASLPIADAFTDTIKEVVLLSKDANGVFSCIARYNTRPIIKTTQNEIKIEISLEVI